MDGRREGGREGEREGGREGGRTLLINTWVMSVEVVVPSPAIESLLLATALISFAPTCIAGSGKLISRAIVTPSLMTSG